MNKENIIKKIQTNKPQWNISLPDIPDFLEEDKDWVEMFEAHQTANQSKVLHLAEGENLSDIIRQYFPGVEEVLSLLPEVEGSVDLKSIAHPAQLGKLDVAIIEGELGVGENGAIWISDRSIALRVIPFITRYLVIVLGKEKIVPKMHQAYGQIDPLDLGFGTFISGPSKTADIEQALVVGAHGPLGLTVVLR